MNTHLVLRSFATGESDTDKYGRFLGRSNSRKIQMKFIVLALLFACSIAHAQTDIGSTNVLTWNSVTNDSTGLPLTTNATYLVGVFTPGAPAPFIAGTSQTNEFALIQVYGQLQRDVIYDVKVRAMAFGYTESDWSDPFPVRRPRGKVGKPTITGIR